MTFHSETYEEEINAKSTMNKENPRQNPTHQGLDRILYPSAHSRGSSMPSLTPHYINQLSGLA